MDVDGFSFSFFLCFFLGEVCSLFEGDEDGRG